VFPTCTGQPEGIQALGPRDPLAAGLQLFHVSMGRAYMTGMVGVLVALSTGCPGPSPPTMDAGTVDADPDDPDAPAATGGLTFRFLADPLLPTAPEGSFNVSITDAHYELTEVRAIGDAAPGDERTSRSSWEIRFEEGANDLVFPTAPQGIYSFLFADVERYVLHGTVDKSGETYDFEISDEDNEVELAVDLKGLELGASPVVCVITMDLRRITNEVEWGPLEPDGEDEIDVDRDYAGIDQLRAAADDFAKQ
jgi:hypothetical protein